MSGPETTTHPIAPGLFDTTADGSIRLVGGDCAACDRAHFPLGPSCPYCGSDRVGRVHLSDVGTLWGWTAVTNAPPGYDGPVPFGFGVVELPDAVRVITRLQPSDPAQLAFGMPMKLTTEVVGTNEDGSEVVAWCFVPAVST